MILISRVIESAEDFLIPLRADGPNGDEDRLFRSVNDNHYFEFLYIRNADIRNPAVKCNYNNGERLGQWRVGDHEFNKLEEGGGTVVYRRDVGSQTAVWYDILVPYTIELETNPIDGLTQWDSVQPCTPWPNQNRQITDPNTQAIACQLSVMNE